MKKRFSILAAALLIVVLALPVLAADVTFVTDDDYNDSAFGEKILDVTGNRDEVAGYEGVIDSNLHNLYSGGTFFCVKTGTYVWYDFTAPEDGTYTFAVEYVGRKGSVRGVNYGIDLEDPTDQSKQTLVTLDPCEDNNDHRYFIFTQELAKGDHQFYILCATGFDDSTLKSCDVYGIKGYLTEKAPEPQAETPVVIAPATADVSVVFALCALTAAGASCLVLHRKKK